ncbi:hypothetical protein AWB79_05482 [Caballeronia hypogeia]|uniref:Shikimate kinase n=1 Tax=Caballeronia hypogeia TaxID=1777140 RepID=A0A158CKM0_9BURK|nr:shikimate kinase [Caballeronia hypogeia]SAK82416.1 hypothetical protein AWB79_05482 [Caballeronia hypogeia]
MTNPETEIQELDELEVAVRDIRAGVVTFDGCTGVGKTTLAMTISQRVGLPLVDLDDFINPNEGHFVEALQADQLSAKMASELARNAVVLVSGVCMREVLARIRYPATLSVYVLRKTPMGLPGDWDCFYVEEGIEAQQDMLALYSELEFEVYAYHRGHRPRSSADIIFTRIAD